MSSRILARNKYIFKDWWQNKRSYAKLFNMGVNSALRTYHKIRTKRLCCMFCVMKIPSQTARQVHSVRCQSIDTWVLPLDRPLMIHRLLSTCSFKAHTIHAASVSGLLDTPRYLIRVFHNNTLCRHPSAPHLPRTISTVTRRPSVCFQLD